ncbi:serine protease [Culex quinquefasciatus]|uniref:Serine protease n=1 Tax=Culex quinquefasciatus TaxID=7176 RepID=B0X8Z8_CULQU|nr:serine protease [Culex quinquefasciatus]|eukprot:XP_001866120.1 serine protease [Culex quinquefasciatus]
MKKVLILVAVLAVASTKSIDIDSSQVQPIETIGIDWSQVQPIQDTDQYWARLPAEMQYLRKPEPDRRIVNGQEATPGQFPYQVFLEYQLIEYPSSCGGSIINSNNVLTAAHCVWRALSGTAIVGVHNNKINEPTQQRIPFAKVFYHADYSEYFTRNDIAIVRLSGHITFNANVQPVRLPAQGDNQCLASFSNSELIQEQNICMSNAGQRGHCYGDSGGPVVVNDSGSALQVGVVSFVHGDGCNAGFPSVSARVTYYLDWVLHVMTL